jgi:hypothetical protein
MARIAKNELHLVPVEGGAWRLYGRFRGKRIRKQSHDLRELESARSEMEAQLETLATSEASRRHLRLTWLTEDQLHDAESATTQAKGRRLIECVVAADRVLPPVAGTLCTTAKEEWLAVLKKRKRAVRTAEKNELRVDDFLRFSKAKHLEDIRPQMCEDWVYRDEDAADYTKITDAQVLRAWLNFCVKKRLLLISPFEIDMKDMSATARTKEQARILPPDRCHALLLAATELSGARMVPYTILATWCFMSPQEIIRTTRAKMKLDGKTPVIEIDTVKRRTAKYRTVTVPANVLPILRAAVKDWEDDRKVEFVRSPWDRIRERAGLLQRDMAKKGRKTHVKSLWQGSILRHTGISYLNQDLTEKARRGKFNEKSVIAEVCRQAGKHIGHFIQALPRAAEGRRVEDFLRSGCYSDGRLVILTCSMIARHLWPASTTPSSTHCFHAFISDIAVAREPCALMGYSFPSSVRTPVISYVHRIVNPRLQPTE